MKFYWNEIPASVVNEHYADGIELKLKNKLLM